MLEVRKQNINNQYYDVVSYEDYYSNPNLYDPKHTAIMMDGIALPVLNKTDNISIGIRFGGLVSEVKEPNSSDRQDYSLDNMIDLSNPKDFKEVIESSQKLRDAEREILMNVDNETNPIIYQNDSPAMRALKISIRDKHCDINQYSHRFGPNFANDKRIVLEVPKDDSDTSKLNDVSLKKLVKYGDSMDMEVSLTIRDKSPDVPNPIGHDVTVVLTGGGYDD